MPTMFKILRGQRSEKQQNEKGKSEIGTLERKTAEIKEKLSRLSFGSIRKPHHSAPGFGKERRDDEAGPSRNQIRRKASAPTQPSVLEKLPTPILELILERCSLKVQIKRMKLQLACRPTLESAVGTYGQNSPHKVCICCLTVGTLYESWRKILLDSGDSR